MDSTNPAAPSVALTAHVPGEGGWTPPRWLPSVVGALIVVAEFVTPLTSTPIDDQVLKVLVGAAVAAGLYSAGPRKQ